MDHQFLAVLHSIFYFEFHLLCMLNLFTTCVIQSLLGYGAMKLNRLTDYITDWLFQLPIIFSNNWITNSSILMQNE